MVNAARILILSLALLLGMPGPYSAIRSLSSYTGFYSAGSQAQALSSEYVDNEEAGDDVYIRIDKDEVSGRKKEVSNLRFLTDERMSGSAQFSESQFRRLAVMLHAQSDHIWIVDCRQESHGFINGMAVSWCDSNNEANLGKTAEEVEAEEAALAALTGTTVTISPAWGDHRRAGLNIPVQKWETERSLAASEGIQYLRLSCTDHVWPSSGEIDKFIAFASALPEDAWLHFHCRAGSGRTGAFMSIYEMMQKPGTPVADILQHQADTGSGSLVHRASSKKSHAQKERCVLIRAVYQYIQANRDSGYEVKWSEWLASHSETITLHVGDHLDGTGYSSDQLVVNDSLEALSAGQATVLVGDRIFNIRVE
ncbi:MAG: hypothetical protein IJV26_11780 [Lachnospiraceae bacterium]|nr:hypothetical protein [Lachnospiraceae bacterium]